MTAVLIWRGSDFNKHTRRITLGEPVDTGKALFRELLALATDHHVFTAPVRLIGAGMTGLVDAVQTGLFTREQQEKNERTERLSDKIKNRFGAKIIRFGGE